MFYKQLKMLPVLVLLTATIASAAGPDRADVVVIGGTPAGVAAAIAAARADKTVIIIYRHPKH